MPGPCARQPSGCAACSRGAPRRVGCASALSTSRSQACRQIARSSSVQWRPTRGRRTIRETAPVRAAAARRRRAAASRGSMPLCQAQQRRDGLAHQPSRAALSSPPRRRRCSACEVERRAEVAEQQEAVLGSLGEHARRMQAGVLRAGRRSRRTAARLPAAAARPSRSGCRRRVASMRR